MVLALYQPPDRPEGMTQRGRVRKLIAHRLKEENILFISAPGGFGKTVSALQFLAGARGRGMWMSISAEDNDTAYFCRRLARGLVGLCESVQLERFLLAKRSHWYSFDTLPAALARLPTRHNRCYIVLDDLQNLRSEAIWRGLPALLKLLPPYISVLLLSREKPPEGMPSITQKDLQFTPDEAAALFAENGRELDETQQAKVTAQSGGWAIGLQALLLSGGDAGRLPGHLNEYIGSQIWPGLDEDTQAFMMRCSVAPELTTRLANRLTGKRSGAKTLRRLLDNELFLSKTGKDGWRFHDLFRDFLTAKLAQTYDPKTVNGLKDIVAEWHYEHGDFFLAARYSIATENRAGMDKALRAANDFTNNLSMAQELNFAQLYVMGLPEAFIQKYPYLLSMRTWIDYLTGDAQALGEHMDLLFGMLPQIAAEYPELLETTAFMGSLDFRVPLRVFAQQAMQMLQSAPAQPSGEDNVRSISITQNFPYFHRSMRDYSEYHAHDPADMDTLRRSFGVMILSDYPAMELCLMGGVYYEQNDLLTAVRMALTAYDMCGEDTHPETHFSSIMLAAAVLRALGAKKEAERLHAEAGALVRQDEAVFLIPNYRAVDFALRIQAGDASAAQEWLEKYAILSPPLYFYQTTLHFTTLRALLEVGRYGEAAAFGRQLHKLAKNYTRPLDVIESLVLQAVAQYNAGDDEKAVITLKQAISTARPYGLTRLFLNEAREVLPILLLLEKQAQGRETTAFMQNLKDLIYEEISEAPAPDVPQVSPQQKRMLSYLAKGLSYTEIAEQAGLKKSTVKTHIVQLYKALDVKNAEEAVQKGRLIGLVEV